MYMNIMYTVAYISLCVYMQIVITGDVPIIYSVHCLCVYTCTYTHVHVCTQCTLYMYTHVHNLYNTLQYLSKETCISSRNHRKFPTRRMRNTMEYNVRWRVIVCYEVA